KEYTALQERLHSPDPFVARRCRILLASADRKRADLIAGEVGCSAGTVRNTIRAFRYEGLGCLTQKSRRPKTAGPLLAPAHDEELWQLLRRSPRRAGKPRDTWTLALLARVCYERGWTPRVLSAEAIRHVIRRLGVPWKRAKRWARPLGRAGKRKPRLG